MVLFKSAAAAALFGACLLTVPPPAQAAPINGNAIAGAENSSALIEARYRGRHHWRSHHHWRGHHWRHRHWGYYDDDAGAALAAGAIFGLAAGAIAANASAGSNAVAYCSQRFRSYDPASGTYLGYDGYRHPCP